jgi:hypothetical protein
MHSSSGQVGAIHKMVSFMSRKGFVYLHRLRDESFFVHSNLEFQRFIYFIQVLCLFLVETITFPFCCHFKKTLLLVERGSGEYIHIMPVPLLCRCSYRCAFLLQNTKSRCCETERFCDFYLKISGTFRKKVSRRRKKINSQVIRQQV